MIYFKRLTPLLIIFAVLIGACSRGPALYTEPDVPHTQLGDNVVPVRYALNMNVDPKADTMSGVVEIEVEIKAPTQQIWIHGKEMTVRDVFAVQEDKTIAGVYTQIDPAQAPSGVARLNFKTPLAAGPATLTLGYETPYNMSLFSAYKVVRGDDHYIVTQFEPMGAREAFPSFDEPRFKVPFDVSITSPSENVVYANTPKIGAVDVGGGQTEHVFATTRPLPTYLIAFGAGPYDVVDYGDIPPNEIRSRPVALRGIAAKGSGDQMDYALKNTDGLLTTFERYFGTPYPYEKLDLIAAPDYAFGAMENPGAIVYREYLLLLDENAPLSQKRNYARVHAHELAHQWFGNLVTPVWWEDIWLNEAFATWMGNKGTDLWRPDGNFDRVNQNAALGAMRIDELATTRKVREPLLRSEDVMNQFDGITYRKGGGVLSMFESFLGEDKFQKGVRLHMDRYADGVATGDDFFASLADASGNPDVVSALKSFVDQPGLPLVSANLQCDVSAPDPHAFITLKQSRYAPLGSKTQQGQIWEIPVCAKFGYGDYAVKSCTLMKTQTAQLYAENHGCADYVMPNNDGAAYYRFTLSRDGWADLLSNLDRLNTRERLSALDSLQAAFNAGEVSSDVYIDGLAIFAASREYDVASNAASHISALEKVLPQRNHAGLAKLIRESFAERYREIVGKDTPDGNLLAPTLAAMLAGSGDDKALSAEFADKGLAYMGIGGPADKTIVAPNLLTLALSRAAASRPKETFAPLLDLLRSGKALEKRSALAALGSVRDSEIAAQLRTMVLSDQSAMTNGQAETLIFIMMGNDALKDETWAWFKANFEAFVQARVSDVYRPTVPEYADFCSADGRDEAAAFFKSKAAIIPGYERSLAQTLESIELCAALKEAKGAELTKALEDLK